MSRAWRGVSDVSCAISGATTAHIKSAVRKQSSFMRVCILILGINDILKGIPSLVTSGNIRVIIKLLKDKGYKIFLVTLPPTKFSNQQINSKVQKLNSFLLSFASSNSVQIINLHRCFGDFNPFSNKQFLENKYYNGKLDKVHLSKDAHMFILNSVIQALDELPPGY